MKQHPLWSDIFDGEVGGLSRRAVLSELQQGRTTFETRYDKFLKWTLRICVATAAVGIIVCGLVAWEHERTWDVAEKATISAIYHSDAKQVKEAKQKAFKRLEIAGASGEGRAR
jgi:hypothetical protein